VPIIGMQDSLKRYCTRSYTMVGVQGIAGVPEPNKPERSTGGRDSAKTDATDQDSHAANSDGVVISNQAQAAAQAIDALSLAANQSDIRADRVAAAKAAIERADYKNPDIVQVVAQRISKFL